MAQLYTLHCIGLVDVIAGKACKKNIMFRCSGAVVAVGLGVWRLAFGALMDDGMSALWVMMPSAASFAQSHPSRRSHYPHSNKMHNGRVGRSPLSRFLALFQHPVLHTRMPPRVTNPKMAVSFSLSTLHWSIQPRRIPSIPGQSDVDLRWMRCP